MELPLFWMEKEMQQRSRFLKQELSFKSVKCGIWAERSSGDLHTQPSRAPSPLFSEPKGLYVGPFKADHSDFDIWSFFLS